MNHFLAEIALVLDSFDVGQILTIRKPEYGVNNENFVIQTTKGSYFLKQKLPQVYETNLDIEREEWNSEALVRIREIGKIAEVCGPILNKFGGFLTNVNDRYYLLYPYIIGSHTRSLSYKQAYSLGAIIVRFHSASSALGATLIEATDRRIGFFAGLLKGRTLEGLNDVIRSYLGEYSRKYEAVIEELIRGFELYSPDSSNEPIRNRVLIHGDLAFSNYLIRGDSVVAILDFDNLRPGDRTEDVVRTVLSIGLKIQGDRLIVDDSSVRGFLEAYHESCKIDYRPQDILYYMSKDAIEAIGIWTLLLITKGNRLGAADRLKACIDKVSLYRSQTQVVLKLFSCSSSPE